MYAVDIFDFNDPSSPKLVNRFTPWTENSKIEFLTARGNYLYLMTQDCYPSDSDCSTYSYHFHIYDLEDPIKPCCVSKIELLRETLGYYLDSTVYVDCYEDMVAISTLQENDNPFVMVNVKDPKNPIFARIKPAEFKNTCGTAKCGNYLIVNDKTEYDSPFNFHILDISKFPEVRVLRTESGVENEYETAGLAIKDNYIFQPVYDTATDSNYLIVYKFELDTKTKAEIQRLTGLAVRDEVGWRAVKDAGSGEKDLTGGLLTTGLYGYDKDKKNWQPLGYDSKYGLNVNVKNITELELEKTPVYVLLDKAGATGAGKEQCLGHLFYNFVWEIEVEGYPDEIEVDLEGSIDGKNWFILDSSFTKTSETRSITNKGAMYVRANLVTLEGGDEPNVTVRIRAGGN